MNESALAMNTGEVWRVRYRWIAQTGLIFPEYTYGTYYSPDAVAAAERWAHDMLAKQRGDVRMVGAEIMAVGTGNEWRELFAVG